MTNSKIEIMVKNSGLIELPQIPDGVDGTIAVAEFNKHIPFLIKRVYYIYNLTNPHSIRGKHAHRKLQQVLFCINGSCDIHLDDGYTQQTICLDKPNRGILLGTALWHTMRSFTNNCILLVLASDPYDEADYIRNYDEFQRFITGLEK